MNIGTARRVSKSWFCGPMSRTRTFYHFTESISLMKAHNKFAWSRHGWRGATWETTWSRTHQRTKLPGCHGWVPLTKLRIPLYQQAPSLVDIGYSRGPIIFAWGWHYSWRPKSSTSPFSFAKQKLSQISLAKYPCFRPGTSLDSWLWLINHFIDFPKAVDCNVKCRRNASLVSTRTPWWENQSFAPDEIMRRLVL